MRWKGWGKVPLANVEITPDILNRQESAHVAELAASIKDVTGGEPMAPIVVTERDGRFRVVAGRDRTAALLLLKAKEIPVRIGEFTPRELLLAEVHENLHRRHDNRDALIARLVETTEQEQAAQHEPPRTRQAAKARARAAVAKDTGLTKKAVKVAEHRAASKARKEEAAAPATPRARPPAPPTAPPIETWGMPISPIFDRQVRELQAGIDAADRALRNAQSALSGLETSVIAQGPVLARLRDDAHRLAVNIRAAKPVALCPWCKCGENVGADYVERCLGCRGMGWITAEQLDAAPPDLIKPDVYAVAGEFMTLAQAQKTWKAAPVPVAKVNGKNGRHLKLTDATGPEPREITVERDAPPADEDIPF